MDISFHCGKCGQHILIDAAGAGMSTACPTCGQQLVVPSTGQTSPAPEATIDETKKCPFCAETIKKEAKVCRFCGRDLVPPAINTAQFSGQNRPGTSPQPRPIKKTEKKRSRAGIVLLVIAVIIFGGYLGLRFLQAQSQVRQEQAFDDLMTSLQKTIQEKNMAAIKAGKARISMTKSDVLRSLGSPDSRERQTDPRLREKIEEVWHYGNYYVTFDYDGKVYVLSDEIDFDKQ